MSTDGVNMQRISSHGQPAPRKARRFGQLNVRLLSSYQSHREEKGGILKAFAIVPTINTVDNKSEAAWMGTSFHTGYFTTEGDQCNGRRRGGGGVWVKWRAFVGVCHVLLHKCTSLW
jgi:hypothetical protein